MKRLGALHLNQSVIKALKLLDLFVQQPELSLADIARQSDLPKPTAYRMLSALEVCGFLAKVHYSDQDIRYRLGIKLLELGNVVGERLELRRIALPHMQTLCREVDEVVHLVVLDGTEAVYIEKVECEQSIRLFTRVGKRSPLHAGSGPKLLLAFAPVALQSQVLEAGPLIAVTNRTITNVNTIRSELKQIVEVGFAMSDGEQDMDTIGISYPIRDCNGHVLAALGVTGLKYRFTGERKVMMQAKTWETATRISADLGYSMLKD